MALPVLSSSAVKFRRVLAHFPQELSLAFAYGSGVFRQAGAAAEHGEMIKYGVISTDTLIDDLFHWKTLYVAGRLQKPVKILTQNENSKLQAALVSNLKSAVTAAFLMLPESFSEEDLYMQIAGLSYSGDFRMIIGEDRLKVQNIVKPNIPHFQKLYSNILQDCPQVVYKHHLGRLEIDKSPEGQFAQLMALPKTLQQKITSLVNPPGKNRDVEEILLQVAHDPDCGFVVHQGISGIVRSSSIVQSAKTILTAVWCRGINPRWGDGTHSAHSWLTLSLHPRVRLAKQKTESAAIS
ncbi:phosphatidate cytidylyltransferase, mitochondrial isoform X5 [Neopelma chrysocephalum]|uniref:phosphatidate cytidylyltransferase, mitochondrial isoform X5 n=1 Tax=Neopelma chrysocephalum TaxID=114329 RepID=UPI000FCCFE27|nr:phosphatidate cytidylyltransferase, mitochondrial isoform X5 [Neopelma chrysocephalum]